MNMIEIFQLPQAFCSTTVNTVILAAVLLGAIRLLGPVRPWRRDNGRGRES
jgi:hypothetical protein